MQAESPITVACIQMEPKIGEKKANVAHSLDKIAEAAGEGARLIVIPELCNSGYVFASRHEAFTLAEPVPNGPTSEAWLEAARRHGAVIVAGICERAGDALYNSAAIVGPDGFIGTYRKVHLWARRTSQNAGMGRRSTAIPNRNAAAVYRVRGHRLDSRAFGTIFENSRRGCTAVSSQTLACAEQAKDR